MEESSNEKLQNMNSDRGDPRKKMIEKGEEGNEELHEKEPIDKILQPFRKDQLIHLMKESILKVPELIRDVKGLADLNPAHREIVICGLGMDVIKETLISRFNKYGEIDHCNIESGFSERRGFILFKHRNGARKALKHPQKKIGSQLTSCGLLSFGAPPLPQVSDHTERKIFVRNVLTGTDPQRLTEFFARYGDIEEGPLGLDKRTRDFKGFCFFVYKSIESVRKALETPVKTFEGMTLICLQAVDSPKYKPDIHISSGLTPGHLQAPAPGFNRAFSQALTAPGFNPVVAAPSHDPWIAQVAAPGFNPVVETPSRDPWTGQALTGFNSAILGPSTVKALTSPGFNPFSGAPSLNPQASTSPGFYPSVAAPSINPSIGQALTGFNSAILGPSTVKALTSPGFNPFSGAPSLNPQASTSPRFYPSVAAPSINPSIEQAYAFAPSQHDWRIWRSNYSEHAPNDEQSPLQEPGWSQRR